MKTELLFAVASLVLVGAVLVFALPTPVQAAASHHWCTTGPGGTNCVVGKGQCEKYVKEHPGFSSCVKLPI